MMVFSFSTDDVVMILLFGEMRGGGGVSKLIRLGLNALKYNNRIFVW